jgi:hypothetical protein
MSAQEIRRDRNSGRAATDVDCAAVPRELCKAPFEPYDGQHPLQGAQLSRWQTAEWCVILRIHRSTYIIGGGSFGKEDQWIYRSIRRALKSVAKFDLNVRLVSYQTPSKELLRIADEFR